MIQQSTLCWSNHFITTVDLSTNTLQICETIQRKQAIVAQCWRFQKSKAEPLKGPALCGSGVRRFFGVCLFSKNVAAFDAGSIPAAVFATATGGSASCQAASAVKACSAVTTGSFLNAGIGLMILPSVTAWSCPASILFFNLVPFCAQGFLSSFLNLQTLIFGSTKDVKHLIRVVSLDVAANSIDPRTAWCEIRGIPSTLSYI